MRRDPNSASPLTPLTALAAVGLLAGGAPAQLAVDYRDADLGGNLDFVLRAPAGTLYVDILSLTEGPTCLPPGHPVGCLDVDLKLFWLSFQIPGLFGTMGSAGELVVSLDVPDDPVLDGLVLNQQMVAVVGTAFTEKSNLCKIVFGATDTWAHSLSGMATDPFGVPAIALPDGRILLAGGAGANLDQCELYDPCRQSFAPAAPLAQGRAGHTVTQLLDGRVLAAGGADASQSVLASAELYDPSVDAWSTVGSLATGRVVHTAALLPDGRVLIAGGTSDASDVVAGATNALASTEFFDPATLTFGAGPALARPHVAHASVVLGNGDVLIGGGATWSSVFGFRIPALTNRAQVYQVSSGGWSGERRMKEARVGAGALLLGDGRALFAGGIGGSIASPKQLDSSETFDPVAGTFTAAGAMSLARSGMAMLLLPGSGLALVAGGATGTDLANPAPTDLAELFDPASGLFSAVAALPEPRAGAAALVQSNHHPILFGGIGAPGAAAIYRE